MGTEIDFALGDRHMMPCADDVLLSCTVEICVVL